MIPGHARRSKQKSQKMTQVSQVIASKAISDSYRYRMNMCRDCTNYKGHCTKNRIARICAEKGMKNK